MNSKVPHIAETGEFFAIHPMSTKSCHKNVIVPSDLGGSPQLLLVVQAEI
jgi:hypothetical protein